MRMTDNDTIAVQLGGSTVVRLLRIRKEAEVHANGVNSDLESLIGRNVLIMLREGDDRRWHILFGRNETLVS